MTTWHNDESIEDTIWFALNAAYSPDACMKENPTSIFFIRQSSLYFGKVKECLEDPSNFSLD
jgi:hypothetical protein